MPFRTSLFRVLALLTICLGFAAVAAAQGVIVPGPCRRCPSPPVEWPRNLPRALPVKSIKIDTKISSQVATTHVDKALVVPVTAVQTRYGTSVVFIVRDNALVSAEVKLGDRLGPRVEIREGLAPGTTIVADGVEGLSAGTRVTPRKAGDAAPAKPGGARS